ncbi:MAG: apolipoprotein N-acyltransferase, partial [Candidatus Aureabacteria bacterium]|nr:apolipoprotein N-acyltransferase [Candidatus Auribacterota bacterium]
MRHRFAVIAGLALFFFLIKAAASLKHVFFYGLISGAFYFTPLLWFVKFISLPAACILILYQACFIGLFAVLAKKVSEQRSLYVIFSYPFLWVSVEYLRGSGSMGFPWMPAGNVFDGGSGFSWLAAWGGVYFISFYLALLACAAVFLFEKKARLSLRFIGVAAAAVSFLLLYRAAPDIKDDRFHGADYVKIALIQPAIPQNIKWDGNFKDYILERYRDLTVNAALRFPELIIWPESSLPGIIPDDEEIDEFIRSVSSQVNTALLIGIQTSRYENGEKRYFNSAVLYSEKGEKVQSYDKCQLVPFGEYVPLSKIFYFLKSLSPIGEGFDRGFSHDIFDLRDASSRVSRPFRFGVTICYEDLFPSINRAYAAAGADFIVNLTNDAWYGYTSAPFLHALSASMRCVENDVPMLRCTNTGLTCFIDRSGIITRIAAASNGMLFQPDVLFVELKADETGCSGRTFYNKTGDIAAYVSLAVSAYLMVNIKIRNLLGRRI